MVPILNYFTQKQPFADVLLKIDVLKNFALFTGKHLCWSLFLIHLQAFRPATFLERGSSMCFPVNIATPTQVFSCAYCEIFKNSFFIKHLWWLLLFISMAPIISVLVSVLLQRKHWYKGEHGYKRVQRRSQNPVKHLRWTFVQR